MGTQPPIPNIEEEPQPSPSDPHPGGRNPHPLQVNFGDAKLWQLMEDLCWEVTLRELHAPHRETFPTPWGNPVGNRDPNVDDWEVNFPRAGGWDPTGKPLSPPAPTQADEDVGHLINTLATSLQLGTLCINTFSGTATQGKDGSVFHAMVP